MQELHIETSVQCNTRVNSKVKILAWTSRCYSYKQKDYLYCHKYINSKSIK
jgi:hypothetical protein